MRLVHVGLFLILLSSTALSQQREIIDSLDSIRKEMRDKLRIMEDEQRDVNLGYVIHDNIFWFASFVNIHNKYPEDTSITKFLSEKQTVVIKKIRVAIQIDQELLPYYFRLYDNLNNLHLQ